MTASFVQRNNPVHLLRTIDEQGDACFFVLRTSQTEFNRLLEDRQHARVNIAHYGEILESGYGDYPNEIQRERLKRLHKVDLPENL